MGLLRRSPGAIGHEGEAFAEDYLRRRGLHPVTRNYRCRGGEIDLVMRDGDSLVFVEVRLRSNPAFGSPADTVDRRKQQRLVTAARHYLLRQRLGEPPCRFDLVALVRRGDTLAAEWLRNIIET